MPSWGKSRGNKLGYHIFTVLIKTAGVFPAYALLRLVTLYYFFVPGQAGKSLSYYFRQRLGWSWLRTKWAIYENFNYLGRSIIDKVVTMSGMPSPFTMSFHNETYLHQLAAEGKGALLVSAHIGNWESAGQLLQRIQTPINIVMYEGEHKKIKEHMNQVTRKSFHVIEIKEDISHIYEINEALQRKEFVCIHADRYVEGNKTIEAPLLGSNAKFPLGPFVLATTFKVPVVFVGSVKQGLKHFALSCSRPRTYLKGRADIPAVLHDYTTWMGIMIKKYPLQWHNYFPFWEEEEGA